MTFLHRLKLPFIPLFALLLIGQSECPREEPGDAIVPGERIGAIRLGLSYAEVTALLGETRGFGADGVLLARYPDAGLELLFSAPGAALTDEARVIALSALEGATYEGPARPGDTRSAIEARLGAPSDLVSDTAYYRAGLGVRYEGEGPDARASQIAVFAPYEAATRAPEMRRARTVGGARAALDAASLRAVDMHLHPGEFARIPALTKQFVVGSVPPFLKPYAPGVLQRGLTPFAPHLGIRAQSERAGIDHVVLFAVYTQRTTGFFTNEELETVLTDPQNRTADGKPWAFGLASINFFDGYVDATGQVDEAVARARLQALSSYFERRRDLFIGIKLAHAHQGVAFDDARYLGVYEVAARHRVPVYLHTGFTPFPQGQNTPPYYDPAGLENTIQNLPEVDFILGHVGQGDARAVEHALSLAARYDNVHLEISALNRPLVLDEHGEPVTAPDAPAQLPSVLGEIKQRGLVAKTLFGSDGPQAAGMVARYTDLVRQTLAEAGFGEDEIHAVLAENFVRLFFE